MGWITLPDGTSVFEDDEGNYFNEQGHEVAPYVPSGADVDAAESGVYIPEAGEYTSDEDDPAPLYSLDPTGSVPGPIAIGEGQTPNTQTGLPEKAVEVQQQNAPPPRVKDFSVGKTRSEASGRIPLEEEKAKGPKTIGRFDVTGADLTPAQRAYATTMVSAITQRVTDLVNDFYADPNYGPEVERAVKFVNDNFDPPTAMELLDGVKDRVDQEIEHLHSDVNTLLSQEINPNRIFANGSGVAAAIGVAVGAMSQAVLGPGTPNVAMQIVQSALERDMQAQRLELQRNQIGAGLRRDIVSLLRQRGLDDLAAFDYLQGYARKVAASQMAKHAARDPKTAIEAMKLVRNLQEDWVRYSAQGNQKVAAKGFEATLNKRRNAKVEQISRELAQPAVGTVAPSVQPGAAQATAPVRPTGRGRAGIPRSKVAGRVAAPKRPPTAGEVQLAQTAALGGPMAAFQQVAPAAVEYMEEAAPIPGIPEKLQADAKDLFDAVESTGLGTVILNGKKLRLYTPIKTEGGYVSLKNSWDTPHNRQGKTGDDVPLYAFDDKVKGAAEGIALQREAIRLNNKLKNYASIVLEGDAARAASLVDNDAAEILSAMEQLSFLAKSDAFKRAMDNDHTAESMAKASNLDVETITKLKGGPSVPGFDEAALSLMDRLKIISPAAVEGWNRAINFRHQNIVDKLTSEAPRYGVELTPFLTETVLSAASGAGEQK